MSRQVAQLNTDMYGGLRIVQHRATNAAAAAAFTLDVGVTPPDWSILSHSSGDRLRRLRAEPVPATATPGLRILARHLLEHAIEHGSDLGELVATANISPEVIEPLLTAALLSGRDTVLAVAAKCGADPDHTARLYEQTRAEQDLRACDKARSAWVAPCGGRIPSLRAGLWVVTGGSRSWRQPEWAAMDGGGGPCRFWMRLYWVTAAGWLRWSGLGGSCRRCRCRWMRSPGWRRGCCARRWG